MDKKKIEIKDLYAAILSIPSSWLTQLIYESFIVELKFTESKLITIVISFLLVWAILCFLIPYIIGLIERFSYQKYTMYSKKQILTEYKFIKERILFIERNLEQTKYSILFAQEISQHILFLYKIFCSEYKPRRIYAQNCLKNTNVLKDIINYIPKYELFCVIDSLSILLEKIYLYDKNAENDYKLLKEKLDMLKNNLR